MAGTPSISIETDVDLSQFDQDEVLEYARRIALAKGFSLDKGSRQEMLLRHGLEYREWREIEELARLLEIYIVKRDQPPAPGAWHDIASDPRTGRVLLWFDGHFKVPYIGWFNHADQAYEVPGAFLPGEQEVAPTHWQPITPFDRKKVA